MPTIPDSRGRYYHVGGTEAKCLRCRRTFAVTDVADGAEPHGPLVLKRMAREFEGSAGKHRCSRLRTSSPSANAPGDPSGRGSRP